MVVKNRREIPNRKKSKPEILNFDQNEPLNIIEFPKFCKNKKNSTSRFKLPNIQEKNE